MPGHVDSTVCYDAPMNRFTRRSDASRFIAVAFLLGLAFLPNASLSSPVSSVKPNSRLARNVRSTFGVSMPCSLAMCAENLDGGTVSGLLLGAGQADSIKFSLPHRSVMMPIPPEWMRKERGRLDAWADSVVTVARRKPNPVYVGQTYFAIPGAVPVAIGSAQESLLITLLQISPSRAASFHTHAMRNRAEACAKRVSRILEEQRSRLASIGRSK